MKKSLLFLSSLLLFFCLLIFPARTFFYACEGVNLWFHTILPSLLPFLILTSLLLETGAARRISARAEVFFQTVFGLSPAGFYALFLGLFCGFPMGARITAQLYEAEEIDRNEACYLLTFCSSPSPAFLSSYVILTAFSGQIHPGFVFGVLYGIAQLAASSLPYAGKVSAVLTCAAFGGLSVAAQTNCMIHNSGLPLWPYLAGKLCCAAFAGTLGLFLFAFLF